MNHDAGQHPSGRSEVAGKTVDYWREWIGKKPSIYLNSFNGQPPSVCDVNMRGLIHDLLDAITALRTALLAEDKAGGEPVYLVATGEIHEGQETYTRHDKPVPLADQEVLYTHPQPQAERVPEGWKLVPVEPTPEMLAVDAELDAFVGVDDARKLYRAMLAAAPTPSAQPVKPLTEERIKKALVSVDPETKRLPPGFLAFARAIEAAHGIKE